MKSEKGEAMEEIKDCPFCGGEVFIEKTIKPEGFWGIKCRNTKNRGGDCCIEVVPSRTKEVAIARWNTRKNPVAVELPPVVHYDYYENGCFWSGDKIQGHNEAIAKCKAALERAGIGVKE